MKTLNERRHHDNIQLSAAQKFVLTKLVAAQTPLNAYEAVSRGNNVVAARDMLTKIGLMTFSENNAEITENGQEALRKEALIDEMGELTEEGQLWGFAETPEEAAQAEHAQNGKPEAPVAQAQQDNPMGGNMPTDTQSAATQDAGAPDAFSIESFEMLRSFQEVLKEQDFLKKSKS
jgi:hypothetical protein